MRMFGFDDDTAELDAQLASLLSRGRGSRDSVEDQARRDFEEILGRRRGKGGSQEMLGDASNLVKIADDLTKESAKTDAPTSDANWERMACALEDIKHQIGAVVARPSAGARAYAWMSANPWRVATILLGVAGAVGLYAHYAPRRKRR